MLARPRWLRDQVKSAQAQPRFRLFFIALGFLSACIVALFLATSFASHVGDRAAKAPSWSFEPVLNQSAAQSTANKLRVLIPATNRDRNLCKTLLTASVLGYPTPTLIAWNETYHDGGLLGGGSHVAKISGVLEYLEGLDSSADDDLVLMMDAYDIWFQLRPDVLIQRYHSINAAANKRLEWRVGTAFHAEDLQQTVVFGAGKRCAPNQQHTLACYPIPASPLPDDVYGGNTDTSLGHNRFYSRKQRYLNSGFALGPVADMRRIFRRAQEKVDTSVDHDPWDDGSHTSDFMNHGSDQSVFNTILGEQEFQREVMRRRHLSAKDTVLGRGRPPVPLLDGTPVEDILSPRFTHVPMDRKPGRPDEFGLGLDYFSQLGQQTVNSESDAQFLRYDGDIIAQAGSRHLFDCPVRVKGVLPREVNISAPPFDALPAPAAGEEQRPAHWNQVALYTNLCLDTVPVMIHHNGDKGAREGSWTKLWIQPYAQRLMEVAAAEEAGDGSEAPEGEERWRRKVVASVAGTGKGISWDAMCPHDYDKEIFRDG